MREALSVAAPHIKPYQLSKYVAPNLMITSSCLESAFSYSPITADWCSALQVSLFCSSQFPQKLSTTI